MSSKGSLGTDVKEKKMGASREVVLKQLEMAGVPFKVEGDNIHLLNYPTAEEVEKKLKLASKAYYTGLSAEVMVDAEYDALSGWLELVKPESVALQEVGTREDPNSGWPKVQHFMAMGSLEKARNMTEMAEWYNDRKKSLK